MKIIIRSFLCLSLLVCAARSSHAQGCRTIYYPNYAMYLTESGAGTTVYTTVLTDGSTTGGPPGPGCNMSAGTHTANSYNTIGSVGGWVNGTHNCIGCYLSTQNNQQLAATSGVTYTFAAVGQVICSIIGTWWEDIINVNIGPRTSNYVYAGQSENQCLYTLNCPNGNANSTCGVQVPSVLVPGPPENICQSYLHDTRLVVNGKCFPVGMGVITSFATNCN